jgi:hypothetical protein
MLVSHEICCNATNFPCDRHTAEVVLSFCTLSLLPALVSSHVVPLLLQWVTTTLPLVKLIGQTVSPMMIEKLQPVFSSRVFEHFYLARRSPTIVGGRVVICNNDCVSDLSTCRKRSSWVVTCKGCFFTAMYCDFQQTIAENDRGMIEEIPGLPDYIKTPYPPLKMPLQWVKDPKLPAQLTMSRSISADPTTPQNSGPSGVSPVVTSFLYAQPVEHETPTTPIPILSEGNQKPRTLVTLPRIPRISRSSEGEVFGEGGSKLIKRESNKRLREDGGEDPKPARKKTHNQSTKNPQSMYFTCSKVRYC